MFLSAYKELTEYIQGLEVKENEQLFIMVADKSSEKVEDLIDFLNENSLPFFGGIYPGLLVGDSLKDEGFIVQKLEVVYSSLVLPYLMRFNLDSQECQGCTALVLVDGLSEKFKDLTDTIYEKLGKNVKYIGGGAGNYQLIHKPCIFDKRGLHKDVLYVCIIKSELITGVTHGWHKLEGPFKVTKANGNTICDLDYYNAFDVYRDVIEDEENITLSKEEFFKFAKDHPFGILQEDKSVVVRDPLTINENREIVCVADIPSESDVYILSGNADTLLDSSQQVANFCTTNASGDYQPFLFDCISRAMYLEDRFEEELENIQSKLSTTLQGALSIGEIASKSNGEIVIHNKSTVLGLLINK